MESDSRRECIAESTDREKTWQWVEYIPESKYAEMMRAMEQIAERAASHEYTPYAKAFIFGIARRFITAKGEIDAAPESVPE